MSFGFTSSVRVDPDDADLLGRILLHSLIGAAPKLSSTDKLRVRRLITEADKIREIGRSTIGHLLTINTSTQIPNEIP